MNDLSNRSRQMIAREYRRHYSLPARFIMPDGTVSGGRISPVDLLGGVCRARAHALQEAVRWGDPYCYFIAPDVMEWMVPVVRDQSLCGGIIGGDVVTGAGHSDLEEALNHLIEHGASRVQARAFLRTLPCWPQERCHEAADALYALTYQISGFKPLLLDVNRERHLQQRQIAEEIHRRKQERDRRSRMDEEQMLLSLIRAGDRKGARRILNQMLGRVFLQSANLTVIRALMIEMMGYLVRRAIEDSPFLEPIMERNHGWMARIIEARDFESLAEVLRLSLDDFISQVYEIGYGASNPRVAAALNFISTHFREAISLQQVAEASGLSTYRIAHLIKEQTGKSFVRHVHFLRVQEEIGRAHV